MKSTYQIIKQKNEWDQIMELLNQLLGKDYKIYGPKIDFGDNCTHLVKNM